MKGERNGLIFSDLPLSQGWDAEARKTSRLEDFLRDDAKRMELPWGSPFVRYPFNKVEDIHHFADNVKPLTRTLNWAFRKDPMQTPDVLTHQR